MFIFLLKILIFEKKLFLINWSSELATVRLACVSYILLLYIQVELTNYSAVENEDTVELDVTCPPK